MFFFQETDYEYFEQRAAHVRPVGPGGGGGGHPFPGGPHPPMLTRPLLPTSADPSKLDSRQQEEVRPKNSGRNQCLTPHSCPQRGDLCIIPYSGSQLLHPPSGLAA